MNEEISKDQAEVLAGIEAATEAADGTTDSPCESSREGDGHVDGDPAEWKVDALHKYGLVGIIVEDLETGETVHTMMSAYSATRFARDILAVAAHVADLEDAEDAEYNRLAAIAVERGWYARWDREGGVLGFREDATVQPGRWVECEKDHPDAMPDVERVRRETS